MKRNLLLLFLGVIPFIIKAQTLKINEISVCNVSKNLDPNYDYSGWMEIYNPTVKNINLISLYFSDERGNPMKYRLLKNRYIAPGGFGLIWFNDEVTNTNGGFLDSDSDGGFLSISDQYGNILDSISYGAQHTNVSYGRKSDGGSSWGFFMNATCGKSNNGISTANEVVAEPVFSVSGGFYNAAQSVEIYCLTPGAKIYYTLDFSDPDSTKTLYTGIPVSITKTAALRAKAYAPGFLEGTIATSSYLINERRPNLPVVLITSDSINLYNDSVGIYCVGTNGIKLVSSGDTANYNQNWTRYSHFEYLDSNQNLCLSQAIGLSISGNQSREYDQKSLELKAKGKYGVKRFDYQFFDDKPACRFKTLVLRNGGQQFIPAFLIKDAFNQKMASSFNLDTQAYLPCAVYLNGKYWGLMPLREKSNSSFVYSNYNYEESQYDMIDPSGAVVGNTFKMDSIFAFVQSADMTSDSAYNYIRKKVDVDNFMRYIATEVFLVNTDWPSKANMRFFCPKDADGKFRWILQDLDKGFTYYSNNVLSILNKSSVNKFYMKFIFYLLQNPKLRNLYIDTQSIVAGSVFNNIRINSELDKMVTGLKGENDYNAARWDNTWVDNLNIGVSDMKKNTLKLKNKAYLDLKTNLELTDTVTLNISSSQIHASVFFNDIQLPLLPYDGKYFKNRQVKLRTADYVNGRKFLKWEIKEGGIVRYNDSLSITLNMSSATAVEAVYTLAEKVRRAGLYINEVSADNEIYVDEKFKYEDWIELYNDSDMPISLTDYFITNNPENLSLFRFTDNAEIIPPFGYAVVWCSSKTQRGGMHTNFKLEKESGKIILASQINNETVIIDSMTYYRHTKRTSFGRCPDGSENLVLLDQSTFKKPNLASSYNELMFIQKNELVSEYKDINYVENFKLIQSDHNLTIENADNKLLQITIFSVTGVKMLSLNTSDQNYTLDTSGFMNGVYIVNLKYGSNSKSVKIII